MKGSVAALIAMSQLERVVRAEDIVGPEWADWYRLSPVERWLESEKLWQTFLALGGSLDPEPDTHSPFFDPEAPRARAAHGRVPSSLGEREG